MRLTIDGVETPLSSRKALAILVYLALQPARSESRERIAALLWSDSGDEHARAALRQTLRRLKADLGRGRGPARRRPQHAAADRAGAGRHRRGGRGGRAGRAADAAARDDADLGAAVRRSRGSRSRLRPLDRGAARAADLAAGLAARGGDRRDEDDDAPPRAGRGADPRRPDPRGRLPRGDAGASGAAATPSQAMRVYERLWKVLDEELDVEPSEKTQALYVAIKQGQPGARRRPRPPPPEPSCWRRSRSWSSRRRRGDLPETFRYFAEIFRYEMIGALSRFRDWLVIDGRAGRRGRRRPTAPTSCASRCTDQQDGITVVDDADRPGERPLRLGRAADRDARRDGDAAARRRCASSRWRSTCTCRRRGCRPRAR